MAFVTKTWKDRISQYPNRRTLTDSNNIVTIVTVGRDEGTVTEAGTPLNATEMNDLENRIATATTTMTAAEAHTLWASL